MREFLDSLQVQQARETAARTFQRQAELSIGGDIQGALELTDEAQQAAARASNIEELNSQEQAKRAELDLADIPVIDAITAVLTDPTRPELPSVFSNPMVLDTIRARVSQDIIRSLLIDNQDLDETQSAEPQTPSDAKDQDKVTKYELPKGERSIRAISIALGLGGESAESFDSVVMGAYREKIEELPEGDEEAKSKLIRYFEAPTKNAINDFLERMATDREWKGGSPKVYRQFVEQVKEDPIITRLSAGQLRTLALREPGFEDVADQVRVARAGQSERPNHSELPRLEDLNALQARIMIRGLDFITRDEFMTKTKEDLVETVFERQFKNVGQQLYQERIVEFSEALDMNINQIMATITLARRYRDHGMFIPNLRYLTPAFRRLVNHPVWSMLSVEEIGQALRREIGYREAEQIATRRRQDGTPIPGTEAARTSNRRVDTDTANQAFDQLTAQSQQ